MKKPKAIRPARWPLSVELEYRGVLRALVALIQAEALAALETYHPLISPEVAATRQDQDEDRDQQEPWPTGWVWLLERLIEHIAERMVSRVSEAIARLGVLSRRLDGINKAEWQRQVRQAWGVDITRGEPWLSTQLSAWEQVNTALIKSIPAQTVDQLRGEFVRGFTEGQSLRQMRKTVMERTGVSRSRADLIALDQVGKLNSALTQYRQRSAGVTSYIWRTALDERVRPLHRAREGREFRWDKPPSDGHPGVPIRCRCAAAPVFPELADILGDRVA